MISSLILKGDFVQGLLSVLAGLITVYGSSLSFGDDGFFIGETRSFLWLLVLLLVICGLKKIFMSDDKRRKVTSFIPALIMSVCHLLGYSMAKWNTTLFLLKDTQTILNALCVLFAYAVILFGLIFLSFGKVSVVQKRTDDKNRVFLFFILILLAYIPWYLMQFPGIMSADATTETKMALGMRELTNYHPVLHTLLVGACLKLGNTISSYQLGIAIYTGLQTLCCSLVFAGITDYIWHRTDNRIIRWGILLSFMLYPAHGVFAVTVWKDIPFTLMLCLLLYILFKRINDDFGTDEKQYIIALVLCALLMGLFRHNGMYMFILSAPCFFLVFSEKGKPNRFIWVFITVAAFFVLWSSVILPGLKIPVSKTSESLSLPLQQIAFTLKRQGDNVPEEILEEVDYYYEGKDPAKLYHPDISDPVKNNFNNEKFNSDPGRFLKLWLKIGSLYYFDYFDATVRHTYGYWYPEAVHWVFVFGIDDELLGIHEAQIIKNSFTERLIGFFADSEYDQYPLLSLIFSPGACFWLLLWGVFYCIYRKTKVGLLYAPIFVLWLTVIASPSSCEYRYVWPMFVCLPFLLSFSVLKKE